MFKIRRQFVSSLVLLSLGFPAIAEAVPVSQNFQLRCGWLINPTPGNIWLQDRDGEWLVGVQGGYQTPGDWPWPKFQSQQWISTNAGDYGYGCACLKMKGDANNHHVLEIQHSFAKPLNACRQDRNLKEPKD